MKEEIKDIIKSVYLTGWDQGFHEADKVAFEIIWNQVFEEKIMEVINRVDHSIDVRYEEDPIEAFNKFIKKWCGNHCPHLIDSDEQDGQFMREKIEELMS